jgi:hypothetical protein
MNNKKALGRTIYRAYVELQESFTFEPFRS